MKVYLVGAGPYDPGLMTVKGMRAIEEADVIIYDKLANPALLEYCDCEKIYVGKSTRNHTIPQSEINRLVLDHALQGKSVVRLKGGDPYLFGRGAEELDFLNEHQIPYEVIPGITSAISVPNYAGIPVTHRDYASSLHIITGHFRQGKPLDMDFHALTALDGTLLFLMSVGSLAHICRGLAQAGMPADMPVAIIENGTTAAQRKFVSDIGRIAGVAEENSVQPPAILVVGKVCGLASQYDWFSRLPLNDTKVVVCGHKNTTVKLVDLLYEQGCDTVNYPCVETTAVESDFIAADGEGFEWLIFTSAQGVKYFFAALKNIGYDYRGLSKYKFAVVGPGTARQLLEYGIIADFIPSEYNAEIFGKELLAQGIKSALIAKAVQGTDHIRQLFDQAGVQYKVIDIYKTVYLKREPVAIDNVDYISFSSASAVHSFVQSNACQDQKFSNISAVCIGKMTAAAAEKYGMRVFIAKEATVEAMANLIMEMKKNDSEAEKTKKN